MNGTSLVCDTNVILYLFKGEKRAAEQLHDKVIYVSVITEIELLSYKEATPSELNIIRKFLLDCIVTTINTHIKDEAIRLRRKYSLKIPDAIICATALFFNLPLLTSDKKLKNIKELSLVFYES